MRPIDADALYEHIESYAGMFNDELGFVVRLQAVLDGIAYQPTIEAEPVKHGQWVGTADGYADGELVYDMWECSECGYDADGADEKPNWNYCPHCGAKMDGDLDD